MTDTYTRPAKTKATAVGERDRVRWSRRLRRKLHTTVPYMEIKAAEEGAVNETRRKPWDDRPQWASVRIRTEQMAIINMMQSRHLKATGKEISRAEVLAALMAEGLERTLNHESFGGNHCQRRPSIQHTTNHQVRNTK